MGDWLVLVTRTVASPRLPPSTEAGRGFPVNAIEKLPPLPTPPPLPLLLASRVVAMAGLV